MSGPTVGRLADGQANQNMRSVPKTRASKDAVSSLGMPVLLQRYTVRWPSPRPVETGTDRTGQSCCGDLGVTMVIGGEDFPEF